MFKLRRNPTVTAVAITAIALATGVASSASVSGAATACHGPWRRSRG